MEANTMGLLRADSGRASENTISLMATSMRACGEKISGMEMEYTTTRMGKCIEEFTILVREMAMGFSITRMGTDMKVIGKTGILMALDRTITVLVKCTEDIIKIIKGVVRAGIFIRMG
jgi:hypothetical protein